MAKLKLNNKNIFFVKLSNLRKNQQKKWLVLNKNSKMLLSTLKGHQKCDLLQKQYS